MNKIKEIIDEEQIHSILEKTKNYSEKKINSILYKALEKKGLNLEEAGYLLNVQDEKIIKKIFEIAGKIKDEIYGERLVFFAPLYLSSYCINDCQYCGFKISNKTPRKKLSLTEVEEQTKILIDMGHKRLLLEFGEDQMQSPINYVIDTIKTIYNTKSKNGEIRRVNINIAATSVEDYKKLKEIGIGTYQLFQETYHKKTYEEVHIGPKQNYERQLFAHNKAFEAGLDDLGIGVLFGLYDYKFDTLGLISHATYLDKKFNCGPHTISVPRIQPIQGDDYSPTHKISDKEFLKLIAVLRLAVPYTGMIISTRENAEIRKKAFEIGISQTSAASKTSPGGYKEEQTNQFTLSDNRPLDSTIKSILEQGLMPSFCTACYREGRTGHDFMQITKNGGIHLFCRPNAILTFKEYIEDYCPEDLKKLSHQILNKYLNLIPSIEMKQKTINALNKIEQGERDIYF